MRTKMVALIAILTFVTLFVGVSAFASPVNQFDTVSMNYSYDSSSTLIGGANGGGPFLLTDSTTGASFITFCIETGTEFSPGNPYTVNSKSTILIPGDPGVTQPLAYGVAYLYSNYIAGTLQGYNYQTPNGVTSFTSSSGYTNEANSANALQAAIWYLLGGSATIYPGAQLNGFVQLADAAHWTNDGNVEVLNLVIPGTDTPAQDMLAVPEPSTMLLIGAGLMGLGFVRRFLLS